MTIQADNLKEQQRLATIRQIVNPSKPAEARKAGRQKKRADPIKGSRTSSCAPSRAPSPSPSSRAMDKTPTKADFAPGKQAPTSDIPMEESVGDRFAMSPMPDTGQTTKDSMWAPAEVPMVQDAASAPQLSKSNIRATAVEQAVAPVRPDPVDTASQPNPTEMANDVVHPAPVTNPALTTYGQPATPSPVAQPSDMELMLQRLLHSAMAPVQAAVADVASRLTEIEKDRDWCPGQDDEDMDLGIDPFTLVPCTPTADRHSNLWAQNADEFPSYSRLTEALTDDVEDRVRAEDEFTPSLAAAELPGTPAQPNPTNDAHPFFFELACNLMQDDFLRPNFAVNPQITESDVANDCADIWDEFARKTHTRCGVVPPPRDLHPPFFAFCRSRISEQFILNGTTLGLLGGSMWPSLPDVPSCAPISDHARGRARPSVAQTTVTASGHCTSAPNKLLGVFESHRACHLGVRPSFAPPKEPSAPPVISLGDRASAPIEIPSSPSTSPHPASTATDVGWHIAGKKGKKLWASIAAQAPKPCIVPPTRAEAAVGFLTHAQLDGMTKEMVINLHNTCFPSAPRLLVKRTTKDAAVSALLLRHSHPQQAPAAKPAASPKPISKSEFTLSKDPNVPAVSGPAGDAASLVRQLQGLIKASGAQVGADLIGGRWSSQSNCNFVLVFSGDPPLDAVLRLRYIFARVFGSAYGLTPTRGYTKVILDSVPTIRETPSSPLPSAQTIRDELSRNTNCHGLLLFGDPHWLTARKEGSRHGSVAFAFFDKDGSRLKDLIQNPPFLFGHRTKARKHISRPVFSECSRCLRLGHDAQRCKSPAGLVVCPICGGGHPASEHGAKCPNVSQHVGIACTCPPVCINCVRAMKPTAKGHRAASASCPLRSTFRSALPLSRPVPTCPSAPPMTADGGPSAPTPVAHTNDL